MFLKSDINKKTKTLLYMIIVLSIIALLLFVFVFYIVYEKHNTIAGLHEEVKIIENRKDEIISTKHLIFDIKEDINKLDSYFVGSDSIVEFIRDVEFLGVKSGVALTLNSVDIFDEGDSSLSLKFTTEGDWDDSIYLLALLESMPVKMDINEISFIKRAATNDRKSYWSGEFSITLLSFLNN